jgi:hypothetical protein
LDTLAEDDSWIIQFAFAQRFYPADVTQAVKLPRARMDATMPDCV